MTTQDLEVEIAKINQMSHEEMARLWRFAPPGHAYFQLDTPLWEAFKQRWESFGGMTTGISKQVGWDKDL